MIITSPQLPNGSSWPRLLADELTIVNEECGCLANLLITQNSEVMLLQTSVLLITYVRT